MKNYRPTAASIRSVRLAGGMVLMAYVTGHLTNLAFGLVSLDLLDRVRIPLMAPWQSTPGQVLLYGALASHLGLGLLAVAQRRSVVSLNRSDAAQLALGLLIPVFLAWHVLRTRGSIVLGGEHATYAVLMINYWKVTPFFGLLQVLGLVAAWVHGCLGLYGWLRLRRWWPVVAPFLYPVAFALPILALLGFVEAGKQALARFTGAGGDWPLQVRAALAKFAVLAPGLQVWRDRFLLGYAIAVIAACLIFAGQAIRYRGRTARVIHAGGRQIAASRGLSLLEIDRQQGMPHASLCSGRARCGTCRVRVLDGMENLSPPGAAETETLGRLHLCASDVRLACQAILIGRRVSIQRLVPASAEEEEGRAPSEDRAADAPVIS
ncbi:MAG: (2Fe-2S)-binding protein [Acetobacteraceae bacterium]|nr:(2Fe-2S)-binding protein [Acetobacteraceae bacterium]MBV8574252.1 (2Fe-2S)-binding protein [Acetobacteraceae bacterium]